MEPPRGCALWFCCFSAGFRTRPCCITVSCTLSRTVPKSTQLLPKKAFLQDGGRAYYIFQYLLDPAFLSLNLEDWRQADAILIYDPKPLELVYIEQTILPSGEAPVIYDCR